MSVLVNVSVGELLDKLSILEIKAERITDAEKLINVKKELDLLRQIWLKYPRGDQDISVELEQLKGINEQLWEIEDDIREKEAKGEFDDVFIELARSVYKANDERARLKKILNQKLGSELVEEKSYSDYQGHAAG